MIYLACPYSDSDPAVREERFIATNKAAAFLMNRKNHVFSPISQCHPIALIGKLPLDWEYWKEYDEKIISICNELCVLTVPGWKESEGVRAEIQIALKRGLVVTKIDPITHVRRLFFSGGVE